jgi:hypothetical chaperone protein
MRNEASIGIDFGTTNTVVAIAAPGRPVRAVQFPDDRELSDVYRSVLCFEHLSASRHDVEAYAGMKAIRAYLRSVHETRFIQSFKSHVASPIFDETRIFGRGYKFEDLLAVFFRLAFRDGGGQLDDLRGRVVSGRPVAFVGSAPDEALAVSRYGEAYRRVGILEPVYVYEPVGAAYYYAQRLKSDALFLVCDFGGGTSDFSLIRFERHGGGVSATPIGHAGSGSPGTTSITGSSTRWSRRISARARYSGHSTRFCRSRSITMRASRAGISWRCSRPRNTSASWSG